MSLFRLLAYWRALVRRRRRFDPYRTTLVHARLRLDIAGIREAAGCPPVPEVDPYRHAPAPAPLPAEPVGLRFVLLPGAKAKR